MRGQPIAFAGLMPHAPVLIPAVGSDRGRSEAEHTTAAMRALAARVTELAPEVIVVVTPHAPPLPGRFGLWSRGRVTGSLEAFGFPDIGVRVPGAESFGAQLERSASRFELGFQPLDGRPLDHGAVVPLWFLVDAGWQGPTAVIGLAMPPEYGVRELGRCIRDSAKSCGCRVAVIASGDMSHRLTRDAPCGFHPRAGRFDRAFLEALQSPGKEAVAAIDSTLRAIAAEDVVNTTLATLSAAAFASQGRERLSYEGPFGVGYCVAALCAEPDPGRSVETLPALARESIQAWFRGERSIPRFEGERMASQGAFVTLRSGDGALRGCCGTLRATRPDLREEIWMNARAAAFRDGRFAPVTAPELPGLRVAVSLLGDPEPVAAPSALDPGRYGVIVRAADDRHGVLLPRVEGIETVERQIAVARHKGGIGPDEPVTLERFSAEHLEETP